MATAGTELMKKISSGEIGTVRSGVARKVRQDVSSVFEEIIEVGARIRPILLSGKRVGWIRGLSVTERKLLSSWFYDQNELIIKALSYATSFSEVEITNLNSYEFRSLLRLSNIMSSADVSLYPYLVPYTFTSSSEDLWRSGGTSFTNFFNKEIKMPDGKTMKILCPSDHSKFWASLCDKRMQAIRELASSYDAVMVAGSMVGKAANKVVTNLNRKARYLEVNSEEVWKNISTVDQSKDLNLNDGWGHAHEDFSEEGLLREGAGMMSYDKHEQFMESFYEKYVNREQKKKLTIEREQGIIEEESIIMTEAEVNKKEKDINKDIVKLQQLAAEESAGIADRVVEKEEMDFIIE